MILLQIVGVFWLIEGFFLVIAAWFGHIYGIRWWALLLRGLISILAGVVILGHPLVSAVLTVSILAYILAFLMIVSGLMEIITAIGSREPLSNKWSPLFGGTLSCLIGVFLGFHPFVSTAVVMSIVGFFAVIIGLGRIVLAFRSHRVT